MTVSATHARNNFFELLDLVVSGRTIVVKKDTKEVAEIVPRKQVLDWQGLLRASKASQGILRNFKLSDSPLRKPQAWKRLGTWDRGMRKQNT